VTRPDPTIEKCYHCGDVCSLYHEQYDEKSFCCNGCKSVYQLLDVHQMCAYYSAGEDGPHQGMNPHLNPDSFVKFAALDDPQTSKGLYKFYQKHHAVVEWSLPQMHCASCVWLLEHLHQMDAGILSSRVNFLERTLTLAFNPSATSLRKLAVLLTQIGYEPHLQHINGDPIDQKKTRRQWLLLGITGFCFANIMLLSLPEYLGLHPLDFPLLSQVFRYISMALALPALYVGGKPFIQNSWQALIHKKLHIDIGITLSITLTFARSVYEIVSGIGAGYLDSMTGILFFMLLGRHFQHITHNRIQFNLNYTHFFPLHVKRRTRKGELETISLRQMQKDDILAFSHQEVIPTDVLCLDDEAQIDYSFITGESEPAQILKNEIIYAGGRNLLGQLHVQVIQPVDHNYLLQLWNKKEAQTDKIESSFGHKTGTLFTAFLLILSTVTFVYWLPKNPTTAWNALTTILIVACPCALLLSATFTHGTLLRHLASHQIFVKNSAVLDKLRSIQNIVFDKTGTLTSSIEHGVYHGTSLNPEQQQWIAALAEQSNHPYSNAVRSYFNHSNRSGILHSKKKPAKAYVQ
jgi:P-type Cu+ transporter